MKRRKICEWLCLLIFLLGLLIFCYPSIHKYYVNFKMGQTIQSYLELNAPVVIEPSEFPQAESIPSETAQESLPFVPTTHLELWHDMKDYNSNLWEDKQDGLCDAWAYENPSFYLSDYGFSEEAFGILTIPKMDLKMPLYLGATWQHMADGAAQLSQTSLPIGGMNTNCVIAGHRGWCGAPYFREIMVLDVGDPIYIQNPWQTLKYQVTEIQIIAPNDVKAIHIKPGRDLVTLLTCHPYASGGRQRYLVICERSDDVLESK